MGGISFESFWDFLMSGELCKSDRRTIRKLADLAWDRELRRELRVISTTIQQMESGSISPFEVSDHIHRFHNGASRELYKQYSQSLPWMGICMAYADGVLADRDIAECQSIAAERNTRYCAIIPSELNLATLSH